MRNSFTFWLVGIFICNCSSYAFADFLTHSVSQKITADNSVHCGVSGNHVDNSYWREFVLPEFGITNEFLVQSVDIGVELATSPDGKDIPAFLNLYSGSIAAPNDLVLLESISANVPDGTELEILNFEIGAVLGAGSTLVVEYFTPAEIEDELTFFIGSNSLGQTDPSYVSALECGVPDPLDFAALGFPDVHFVMNVHGTTNVIPEPSSMLVVSGVLIGLAHRRRRA